MRLDELARQIDAEVVGDGSLEVNTVSTLDDAQPGQISFLANAKYQKQLEATKASAVIVAKSISSNNRLTLLKTSDPYFAFRQAVVLLHGYRQHPHEGVHPKAHVEETATIGKGTVIYPGAYIGPRVWIGQDCIIYPNVVIYDDTFIGDRVIIHGGTAIGQDGFGFSTHKGVHHKIPQIGNVVVEDDVEIGSNCTIERAALGSTLIGTGTKIDNLVVIGHGAKVGPHCLLVAQTGIAGSVTIGHHVTMGGQVGIAGHLKVGDNVTIAAKAGVMSDVPDQTVMMGIPAMAASQARRVYLLFTQLPEMAERLKQLEQQVEELGESGDTPLA
ncbi:MAG TPA: UDP-3-O-(3-hydroxymyristoyl)glucosamine N-acyltransferase [Tepidisphaeraceae bacterium]|nr:UDP-3-O-(3-hydroxymyristoyl)glucosamine N-acyltransferase [Tepidisphaeraceae bacterium]